MSNIFDVGSSALTALQRAISTTGNNIANVNTEGYSRQEVEFRSRNPDSLGGHQIGTGVEVTSIRRAYDQFITVDIQARASSSGYYSLYASTASQIDNLMADPATSISSAMDQFFASMEAVANSPTSQPERQVMLSEAQTLANRFNYVDARLSELAEDMNQRMGVFVEDINRHLSDVAALNEQIKRLERRPAGSPNELLDERDRIIESLSKIMRVDARSQEDGSINLYSASGHRLVSQAGAETLRIAPGVFADGPVQIFVSGAGQALSELTDHSLGGELGAALDVSTNMIDRARREIGLVAMGLSANFNIQHKAGATLNQTAGGDFFSSILPVTTAAIGNSGTTNVSATIDNTSELTGASYRVDYTDSVVTVTNLVTGDAQEINGTVITLEGVRFEVSPFSNLTDGDSFVVEPTGRAAASIGVDITDTSEIAAANLGGSVGDNRNMLSLIALRESNNLKGGTQSVYDIYNNAVSQVAVDTRSAKANAETEESLLNSVKDQRASITGVNLEEEAANLIRYQQAYQAAAQIITTANDMFDTLLRATSR
ncbi:flagellar hook-associated protein FlgK [gamma proteobacterium HIMB55]|nr:flagellar hook-associated protein FlgK [gamma proteobacterium HIMB55]